MLGVPGEAKKKIAFGNDRKNSEVFTQHGQDGCPGDQIAGGVRLLLRRDYWHLRCGLCVDWIFGSAMPAPAPHLQYLPAEVLLYIIGFLTPTFAELSSESFKVSYEKEPILMNDLGPALINRLGGLKPKLTADPEDFGVSSLKKALPKQKPTVTYRGKSKDAIINAKAPFSHLFSHFRHPNVKDLTSLGSTCKAIRTVVRPLLFRTILVDLWTEDADACESWIPPGKSDKLFDVLKYNPAIANEDVQGVIFYHSKMERESMMHPPSPPDSKAVAKKSGPNGQLLIHALSQSPHPTHYIAPCKERLEKWARMVKRFKSLRALAFQCVGKSVSYLSSCSS